MTDAGADADLVMADASPPAGVALATWGLFVGFAFLQLAGGLFGTLLGVRSELAQLPTALSSLISAAYYAGFLLGTRVTLEALGRVGHIRVYSALAAVLSAAMVAVGLTAEPAAWMLLRFVTGLCLAGLYVVAESWLNNLATNDNRGRLLAVYLVVSTGAFGLGQVLLFALDARTATGYALAGIAASLAVVPVALSEHAVVPVVRGDEAGLTLRQLAREVPIGAGSCLLVGLVHGGLTGMAAIYATRVGMSPARTGLFVAAPNVGGMLLQWPIAAASDEVDRRAVGAVAAAASLVAGGLLLLVPAEHPAVLPVALVLGGFSFPLYSIAAAYTNDWIDPRHVSSAASQLITLYGLGAIVGPLVLAGLMVVAGPAGFWWAINGIHLALVAFFLYRMRAWRSPLVKRPWDEVSLPARMFFLPGTVVALARRYRHRHTG